MGGWVGRERGEASLCLKVKCCCCHCCFSGGGQYYGTVSKSDSGRGWWGMRAMRRRQGQSREASVTTR